MLSPNTFRQLSTAFLFLVSAGNANAAFINVTNTATEFSGSFIAEELSQVYRVRDTAFSGLMPGTIGSQSLQTIVLNDTTDLGRAFLSTPVEGTPDNPSIRCDANTSCGSLSGSYDNNPLGKTVDFAYTNLQFDGTTFTGDFSFTVSEVPLPAAAWLFASAILGLGISGRARARR